MEKTRTVRLRKLIDGQCGHAWKVGHTVNYSPGTVNLHYTAMLNTGNHKGIQHLRLKWRWLYRLYSSWMWHRVVWYKFLNKTIICKAVLFWGPRKLSRYNDSVRARRSRDLIPGFYTPVQTDREAHSDSCRVGKVVAAWCWPPTPHLVPRLKKE